MDEIKSKAQLLADLPDDERRKFLSSLSDADAEALLYEWRNFLARPSQIAPDGEWSTWMALAGRGWGKSETGAQWVREIVKSGVMNIAIIAETQKDLEEVMVRRILSVHPPHERPKVRYKPVRILWPNGAEALGYNGTEPDQLRGPEFEAAWCDELAKYRYARDVWDMLQFTMRSGNDPRTFVSTTPRPIPIIKEIARDKTTIVTRGSTFENAGNLPEKFLDRVKEKYSGTRLGRQELGGEIIDDIPGALWTRAMIDEALVKEHPDLVRVVVAVDPSGTKGKSDNGDSIGIVVAGQGVDGNTYILADRTCKLSPSGWGRRAYEAYTEFDADRVIAERNFGGAMVEHVIRTVDPKISYKEITASRGKVARAEPVAALYEQGKVKHVGSFTELEDQMCLFGDGGYEGDGSPDRADALVWAVTELALGRKAEVPQLSLGSVKAVPSEEDIFGGGGRGLF